MDQRRQDRLRHPEVSGAHARQTAGTTILIHLNDEGAQYANGWRLQEIVKKYSNHIAFPILLTYDRSDWDAGKKESVKTRTTEQVNAASAMWRRSKSELTDDDYKELYKTVTGDLEDPLFWFHTRAEGTLEYTTLFYIPAKAPLDLYQAEYKGGVKLYVKRVFIMDDSKDLLPQYLRFVRGIIDSEDLPLNVSREILQEEFRFLVEQTGFGAGRPLTLVAHDMGAPPALLWAAKYPDEIAALLYIEAPVMLQSVLEKIISYTPQAVARGSMWWWILPLAPGVPEALMVGKERGFLNWFYRGDAVAQHEAISVETVDEYLRTFSGVEGVLGALGVYRTAVTTMAQTLPLTHDKVQLPVIAMGGEKGLGERVGQFCSMVAADVESVVLPDCGHFIPEEYPEAVLEQVDRLMRSKAARR